MSAQVIRNGATIAVLMDWFDTNQILIQQSAVSSIIRRIVNVSSPASPVVITAGQSLSVGSVIFNSPQTDYGWENVNNGYNFRDEFALTQAGTIQVSYTITDTGGNVGVFATDIAVRPVA